MRSAPGGYILYDSSWPLDAALIRDDVTYIGVPLAQMCNENFRESRERVLMKNIATAGVLIELLNIDRAVIAQSIEEKYGRKKGLRDSNQKALRLGADYVRENFPCPLPFHLQTMDANADKILIDGNTAAALGCVYAGATVAAWYPITPSTSTMDAFKVFCDRYPQRQSDGRTKLPDPAGGRRTRRHRHGHRRFLERRARFHLHRRTRHLADE